MQFVKKENDKFTNLIFLALGIIIMYVQIIFLNRFSFILPNITFIFVVLFSLYVDGKFVPFFALILGFIIDSIIGKFTGEHALSFFVSSYISSHLNKNIRKDVIVAPMLVLSGFLLANNLFSYIVSYIHLKNFIYSFTTFLKIYIIDFCINMIFSIIVIFVITKVIIKKQVI